MTDIDLSELDEDLHGDFDASDIDVPIFEWCTDPNDGWMIFRPAVTGDDGYPSYVLGPNAIATALGFDDEDDPSAVEAYEQLATAVEKQGEAETLAEELLAEVADWATINEFSDPETIEMFRRISLFVTGHTAD